MKMAGTTYHLDLKALESVRTARNAAGSVPRKSVEFSHLEPLQPYLLWVNEIGGGSSPQPEVQAMSSLGDRRERQRKRQQQHGCQTLRMHTGSPLRPAARSGELPACHVNVRMEAGGHGHHVCSASDIRSWVGHGGVPGGHVVCRAEGRSGPAECHHGRISGVGSQSARWNSAGVQTGRPGGGSPAGGRGHPLRRAERVSATVPRSAMDRHAGRPACAW